MLGKFLKKTVLQVSGATILALASFFIVFFPYQVSADDPDWQYFSIGQTLTSGIGINQNDFALVGVDCSLISNISALALRFHSGNVANKLDVYIGDIQVVSDYSTTTGYKDNYFYFSETECGDIKFFNDNTSGYTITVAFQTTYLSNPIFLSYDYNSGNSQDPTVRQPIMGIYAEGPPPPPPPPPPPIDVLLASSTITFPLVTNFELASVTAFSQDQMYMLFFGILYLLTTMMDWFLSLIVVASIFVLIYSAFRWLRILK